MDTPFAYDALAYQTHAQPDAHPDRLFVVGSLFGLSPAPVTRCRYLEVGCGTGTHLMAAAVTLPGSEFVGLDLSRAAVERGRALLAEVGLTNVTLLHADLARWEPDPGAFDYVAAHGVYSWVPAEVRDRLLAVCAAALPPDGIAYVSYNALPGCHFRRALWDMLKFHARDAADPDGKLRDAYELLDFVRQAWAASDEPFARAMAGEAERASAPHDAYVLYHDDLAELNDPVYLVDFARHAERHRLRVVADADFSTRRLTGLPPEVAGVIGGLRRQDPLLAEQYLDFVRLRRFRSTLLCHADRTPTDHPLDDAVTGLFASTAAVRQTDPPDFASGEAMEFLKPTGARVRVDRPLSKAVLTVLADRRPEYVPFAEVVRAAAERVGGNPDAARPAEVAAVLLDGYTAGLLRLHGYRLPVARVPGERPVASPLARVEARTGSTATTLLGTILRLEDEASRAVVRLMDGTRDRAALAAELAGLLPKEKLDAGLDASLTWLAKAGLLLDRAALTPPAAGG